MCYDLSTVWPDWQITRLIGEGSFGKVYEIVRNNYNIEEHCALKIITIPTSNAELRSVRNDSIDETGATEYFRGLVEEFTQEIALMSKLKGTINIVNYEDYKIVEHKDSFGWDILIRMELLKDLPSILQIKKSLSQKEVCKMAIDLCSALEICHKKKIIHRDIKPDNIFVDTFGNYKLGDFGVARTIEKTVSGLSKKGTYTYMAPEVYKSEEYGFDVDIYSLGIVMYRLLNNNREPFLPPAPQPIKFNDKNEALVRRMSGEKILPIQNVDPGLNDIILKACSYIDSDRYQKPEQMKADLMSLNLPEYDRNIDTFGYSENVQPVVSENEKDEGKIIKSESSSHYICPNCGQINDMEDNFCLQCGFKFIKPENSKDKSNFVLVEANKIVCTKCGAKNDNYDKYCLRCGQALTEIPQKKIICNNCGATIKPENSFCYNCGMKIFR